MDGGLQHACAIGLVEDGLLGVWFGLGGREVEILRQKVTRLLAGLTISPGQRVGEGKVDNAERLIPRCQIERLRNGLADAESSTGRNPLDRKSDGEDRVLGEGNRSFIGIGRIGGYIGENVAGISAQGAEIEDVGNDGLLAGHRPGCDDAVGVIFENRLGDIGDRGVPDFGLLGASL